MNYVLVVLLSGLVGHWVVLGLLYGMGMGDHLRGSVHRQASRWIGYLERMVITTLVLADAAAATVFIFGAKAAVLSFRIPSRAGEGRRETVEYMLVGTLCSYLVALAIGFAGKLLVN